MVDTFHTFLYFSGLKPEIIKFEIDEKNNDTLKILGTHSSYDEKLKMKKVVIDI